MITITVVFLLCLAAILLVSSPLLLFLIVDIIVAITVIKAFL